MAQPEGGFESAREANHPNPSKPVRGANSVENGLALSYCPRCSARLAPRSCKLMCPGCRYYMSCSDYY